MEEEYKKAGEIAKKVHHYIKSLLKPGESILNIAESIEQKIIDLGGFPAFPVNISINNIAAHYTPNSDDKITLKEGDVVKIDFGVHIDGYPVDTAATYEINDNKYKDLIEAAKNALIEASKKIKKDIKVSEIGDVIEKTIKKYNYNPLINLSGHGIDRYILHSNITIPNYNNNSNITIKEGVYAIEPFASTKDIKVIEGNPSTIYSIINIRPVRNPNARKLLEYIYEKYKTLPFCYRWLKKEYNDKDNLKMLLDYLKSQGILYEYPILITSNNNYVSQFETTFYVKDNTYDLISFL